MADIVALVLKATEETNTSEDWGSIIDLLDKIRGSEDRARTAVKALIDRLQSRNGNVIMFTVTVADAIVKNLGVVGQREVASRAFLDALVKRLGDSTIHETIKQKILDNIQQWASSMKSDPSLGYMADVYSSLKAQGFRFPTAAVGPVPAAKPSSTSMPPKPVAKSSKEEEDEELQLALAISLSEFESRNRVAAPKSSAGDDAIPTPKPPPPRRLFQVRALYDFPGDPSQGELPLTRGDIVDVVDTTFKEWWRGELRSTGSEGVFPRNYTEKIREEPKVDLNLEREVLEGSDNVELFLKALQEVDPRTDNLSENEKLQERYRNMLLLRPKVITLIEFYRHRKDELRELSETFSRANQAYQRLLDGYQRQVEGNFAQQAGPYYGAQPAQPSGYDYQYPAPQQSYSYDYSSQQQQQYPSY